MVHKRSTKISERQMEGLEEIIEIDMEIDRLGDAELTLDDSGMYAEADASRTKQNELRKEMAVLVRKHFRSKAEYRKANIKYGKRFR